MTFGTKLGGGVFTTENLLQLRVPWWHFEISEVYLSEVTALYYRRSKSSFDRPRFKHKLIERRVKNKMVQLISNKI